MKPVPLLIIVTSGLVLTACGEITVTGDARGDLQSNNIEAAKLTLVRGTESASNPRRLVLLAGRPESELLETVTARLRVDVTGNPNDLRETYHFLALTQDEGTVSGGTSNERSFVVNNLGRLLHLSRRRGDARQEAVLNGKRHVGTTVLAIVQDDDRTVPWRIEQGDARCFSLPGNDCVDMETITRELFGRIADRVSQQVRDTVPFGSVTQNSLHFVPRAIHNGLEAGGRRARGFGLIYRADITLPTAGISVFVPISVLLASNVNTYSVFIDPFGMRGTVPPQPENMNRIVVRGSFPANLGEGAIRDQMVEALRDVELPQLIPGVELETTLLAAFNVVAGAPHLSGSPATVPPFYEAILLPEATETNLDSTIVWRRGRGPDDTESVQHIRLVFLE